MTDGSYETQAGWPSAAGKLAAIGLFVLLLLAPTPEGMPPEAKRLAAVAALMAVLWLTQAVPIAATSLVPLAAFPLLGIQSADEVSQAYIDENIFLFLGGFIIALGIEKWGLHQRISLHIIRVLGTSLRRVVLGFMLATAFLSMWISNTAATLLMLPIGLALVKSLKELALSLRREEASEKDAGTAGLPLRDDLDRFAVVLMLGIAYSASLGGLTTLVGTPTNIAYQGIWKEQFPDAPEISAGEWLATWFPLGAVFLLCAWGVLAGRLSSPAGLRVERTFFTARLRELGRPSRVEWLMLAVFTTTALLWITRKPLRIGGATLLPGWGEWVAAMLSGWGVEPGFVDDSTVAMGMALLMFFLPAARDEAGGIRYLMDWRTAERLPWGILLLFGGGFALAGGFDTTGLAEWIGNRLAVSIADWPVWLIIGTICLVLTFLTELTSNVATVSALLPILAGTAIGIGLDPRLVMIPATISASCAFMLPVATPPNAIVFGSGRLRMGQMARYGLALNLLGVVLITAATFVLLVPQLGISLDVMPDWAVRSR